MLTAERADLFRRVDDLMAGHCVVVLLKQRPPRGRAGEETRIVALRRRGLSFEYCAVYNLIAK